MLALCHEHAEAEARFDVARILATLSAHPRYEFFPAALVLEGGEVVRRFYEEQYPRFAATVTAYALHGEWANDQAAVQEYTIALHRGDEGDRSYRVLSLMPVDEASGRLAGERLFCDEDFVGALLGPLVALTSPVRDV